MQLSAISYLFWRPSFAPYQYITILSTRRRHLTNNWMNIEQELSRFVAQGTLDFSTLDALNLPSMDTINLVVPVFTMKSYSSSTLSLDTGLSANIERVGYCAGHKARQYWWTRRTGSLTNSNTTDDKVNRIVTKHSHPKTLQPFLPELDAFAHHNDPDITPC
ncbi:hypothetical protein HYDPIDRAFT_28834 [Hydnomerulius pinastri MD-312]|uniref:Uncharacterized protein n=1 Tax=Hydnomerulius pinastri MD-312 TaxID=994086 RepID=A0A0C9W8P4_9AGAM|nr:hypothetical protein HYDPIDRAFT_28834 [Hydnomerulius pinastri MD-312]